MCGKQSIPGFLGHDLTGSPHSANDPVHTCLALHLRSGQPQARPEHTHVHRARKVPISGGLLIGMNEDSGRRLHVARAMEVVLAIGADGPMPRSLPHSRGSKLVRPIKPCLQLS